VAANRQQCPHLPYTPDEYAEEAARARDAGASVVHVRARHPETGAPLHTVDGYRAIIDAIRARADGMLVSVSTSTPSISRDERTAPARELRPELAALALGSLTYGIWSTQQKRFQLDAVQPQSFGDIVGVLEALRKADVKPDHTCFDAGQVANLELLLSAGHLDRKPAVTLVLGVHGAAPATVQMLSYLVSLVPADAHWQAAGVRQPEQWRVTAAALALGCSVRVGLEDNFYLSDGAMATSNGQLVEKAARMARDIGRGVAEPKEARAALGIS
jgi:uncharacterized protein (DUF849 family)